ncbi:MAG: 50S ribosomal protein L11 methyltransferase, partial [Nitrospirae bacterium]|nr:50S ribosomal protein L11 methyltransferase [Nitrospirota bacterium]
HRLTVGGQPEILEVLGAFLFTIPTMGTEEFEGGFHAYFTEGQSPSEVTAALDGFMEGLKSAGLDGPVTVRWDKFPNVDWTLEWKKGLKPIEAGSRLVVLAPWHVYAGGRLRVIIEPGMAFGTGHHATTRMCLEEIEALSPVAGFAAAASPVAGRSMLDVGTGTGVLAISASLLGYHPVAAIDNDPVAVEIAVKNASINRCPDVSISSTPVGELSGRFSVIACNLTAGSIIDIARHLKGLLAIDGRLILSGILEEQEDSVSRTMEAVGFKSIRRRQREGWVTLVVG